jgi:hypothetical protein
MTTPRVTVLFTLALLTLAGCIVEQRPPVAYRTYPPGSVMYAPPTQPMPTQPMPPALPEAAPGMPPVPGQEQPEVLTRGPVHEAFAQPLAAPSASGAVVATQPPAAIIETPPAERPAGGVCTWVPGYWSWDAEQSRFIWVSGCWRVTPARMTWVPGYWARVPGGWQWVSGFWAAAATQELAYLPAPPAVTEAVPAATADQIWVPGCWYWAQGRYVFRAGYWLQPRAGWVWTPSHYVWTPRGYVFVEGFWDYPLESRGVLFAPVCFSARIGSGVRLSFSPSITVDLGVVSASLFACPRYTHYYFGDYYDDAYVSLGIYPWFDCLRLGLWYDPIFVYTRWDHHHNRHDDRWEDHARQDYRQRHDNRDLRPPRTYREQEERLSRLPEPQRRSFQVAQPLHAVAAKPSATVRLEHADADTHRNAVRQSEDTHKFREARSDWERATPPAAAVTPPVSTRTPPAATTPPASRGTPRTTAPTAPVVPSAPSRDSRPEIQPDRVRIPASFVTEAPAETPASSRGSSRKDRDDRDDRGSGTTRSPGDSHSGRSGGSRW